MSLDLDRLCVVLVATRNPLNLGAAARAMSNFGFRHLRVVNPYEPAFREARSAVGGRDVLRRTEQFSSVAEAVADCTLVVGTSSVGRRALEQPVYALPEAARLIRRRLCASSVAIVFGSEKTGLTGRDLAHCHWILRIPTRETHRSMNLGQAVAVCLFEVARGSAGGKRPRVRASAGVPAEGRGMAKQATAGDLDRIAAVLHDVLQLSGYTQPHTSGPAAEKIIRLLRRVRLSSGDTGVMLGMLRQILWKLRSVC